MRDASLPPTEYRLLAELEAAFDAVIERTAAVAEAHAGNPGACWIFGEPEPVSPAHASEWLRQALQDVWYQDGQDGRATRAHIGLVAASERVMEAVAAANAAKAEFAALTARIREQVPSLIPEAKAVLPFRHPALHHHLRGEGLARVHLKQCWRAIPSSEAPLARVRLAWYASGRSIRKLTVQEAEQKLLALDTDAPHIRIQLKKLAGIPSGEPLAQVQRQAPLMRANLFYREPLDDGRTRRAMNVALPLFIPAPDGRLPDHNRPPLQPPQTRTRARRRDEKLEDEPFLKSLRVYRYR